MLITTNLTRNRKYYYSVKSKKLIKVINKVRINVPYCIEDIFNFTEGTKYRHIKAQLLFSLGFSFEDIQKWNKKLKNPVDYLELKLSEGVIKCNFFMYYGNCLPDNYCINNIKNGSGNILDNIIERNENALR